MTEASAEAEALSEEQVVAYLKAHPQLLTRYPDALEALELSHASGSAVSLIERQVEVLRGRNARLDARLARTLIRAPSLAAIAAGLRANMREDFDVDEVFLGVNGTAFKRHDIEGVTPIEPGGAIARAYDNFFRTRLIECGPIDEAKAKLLFPKAEQPIRSAAIVPLEKEKNLGVVALGSRDAGRFVPRQGKLFLEMVAELIAAAVRARLV